MSNAVLVSYERSENREKDSILTFYSTAHLTATQADMKQYNTISCLFYRFILGF